MLWFPSYIEPLPTLAGADLGASVSFIAVLPEMVELRVPLAYKRGSVDEI